MERPQRSTGRNSLSHKLEAIYRDTDGKNLADILNEMTTKEKVVYFERVTTPKIQLI